MAREVQPNLSPKKLILTRIRPEKNERRFYAMAIISDFFGETLLCRNWGRIGTPGRQRLDPCPDADAAMIALERLAHAKRKRGYSG